MTNNIIITHLAAGPWVGEEVRRAVKLKESYGSWMACGTPEAADSYWQQLQCSLRQKYLSERRLQGGHGERILVCTKAVMANCPMSQEGRQQCAHAVRTGGAGSLTLSEGMIRWWREYQHALPVKKRARQCTIQQQQRLQVTLTTTYIPPKSGL